MVFCVLLQSATCRFTHSVGKSCVLMSWGSSVSCWLAVAWLATMKRADELVRPFTAAWLTNHNVQKLVLVVCEADSGATLERWQFDLECDRSVTDMKCGPPAVGIRMGSLLHCFVAVPPVHIFASLEAWATMSIASWCSAAVPSKSEQEIQKEIQNLLRQIVASVSFLPLLDVPCMLRASWPLY
jgi:hypothetical protein